MARPVFTQANNQPLFIGLGFQCAPLLCRAGCGNILIKNFDPSCFVGIDLKCSNCGEITSTASLPEGEVLPMNTIVADADAGFKFKSFVEYKRNCVIASRLEIENSERLTKSGTIGSNFEMSKVGLDELVNLYESVTGVNYSLQRGYLTRGSADAIHKVPFAWAVDRAMWHVEQNRWFFDDHKTEVALLWIAMFLDVVSAWSNHPRFKRFAADLGKPESFLHTCFQLMTAAFWSMQGIRIGISLEDKAGESNPDLYVKINNQDTLYLEVKAPRGIQYHGSRVIGAQVAPSVILKSIKSARQQINRKRPGIVVVGTSLMENKFEHRLIEIAKRSVKTKGRDYLGMAGLGIFCPASARVEGDALIVRYYSGAVSNPYYEGPKLIELTEGKLE